MKWEDVSEAAREVMKDMGNFSPTVNAKHKMVKGYMHDDEGGGKVYLDSGDLRTIAAGCIEVADWLEKRAAFTE
ncbi:hypothetical protein KBW71_03520 [Hydrogenophaga aromaticivorans]|uniref:hypothetical protein n=1 Tax=Hydrogenophaga aromaticivorans TaxID=2610898 RepID=UPI001B35D7FE|nr:hypothetical protein [Hydrogenophaga aromaticivorans]MBQ0917499.1 hypothetical protein [Hydrogenophaga aromaticivorans]